MRKLSKLNQERIINGLGIIPLEEQEQETFVNYMELLKQTKKVLKFTAIPHETPTKRKVVDPGTGKVSWVGGHQTNAKNKRKGVRAGLPDLFIIYKKNDLKKAVFIEMKRKQGGTVSKEQKEWIKLLNETDGLQAYVAKGFDEAKQILDTLIFK